MQVGKVIDDSFRLCGRFGLRWLLLALPPVAATNAIALAIDDANAETAFLLVGFLPAYILIQVAVCLDVAHSTTEARPVGPMLGDAVRVLPRALAAAVLSWVAVAIGLFLLIVPGLFALTRLAVVVPAVTLERIGVGASLTRSNGLVRGRSWSVFGTLVVLILLNLVATIVLVGVPAAIVDSAAFELTLGVIVESATVAFAGAVSVVLYQALLKPAGLYDE